MTDLQRIRSDQPVTRILEAIECDGGVIVEGLLAPDVLARLNADIDPWLADTEPGRPCLNPAIEWFMGKTTRHLTGIAAKSQTFATDVLCHPLLLQVCDAILLPSCSSYKLNVGHVLDRGPGAEPQLLHRDQVVWNDLPKPHPEIEVASVMALADFTEENGATRVIPGSHKWPLDRMPTEEETIPAVMKAGDAIVYLGSTIHGGGPNTTSDVFRRGMHMSYVVGWLRSEENNCLGTPLEIARKLPRQSQELIGYAAYDGVARGGGFLGAVDVRDPVEMIEKGDL
ncbi:MAG: phytanoyl-CoA dioxygenase family protein [bacterium]|nr:phytanoyl-CoA dioxygenase family protein [bacterium]